MRCFNLEGLQGYVAAESAWDEVLLGIPTDNKETYGLAFAGLPSTWQWKMQRHLAQVNIAQLKAD